MRRDRPVSSRDVLRCGEVLYFSLKPPLPPAVVAPLHPFAARLPPRRRLMRNPSNCCITGSPRRFGKLSRQNLRDTAHSLHNFCTTGHSFFFSKCSGRLCSTPPPQILPSSEMSSES